MAKKGALQVIADVMVQNAGAAGWAHYKLGAGYNLSSGVRSATARCAWRGWRRRASGRVRMRWQSCVRRFGPDDAEEVAELRERTDAKTGCTVGYNVVEVSWMEVGS